MLRFPILLFLLTMIPVSGKAQSFFQKLAGETDTSYVESYLDHLTTRIYASIKTTEISLRDEKLGKNLVYKPNDALILGLGVNYGILGLNIGLKFPFMNDDDDKYGKTRYLDLQTHIYLRPATVDVYLQYYKGYYITNPNDWIRDWPSNDTFPKRPDIYTISIGLNGQYIFNHRKFSYRAPFLQNEWQKKSAGSFLLGGQAFYVDAKGDSSLIPMNITDTSFFDGLHYSQVRIINAGLNAGYAQTFVLKQRFFLTLSLVGGLSGGGSWFYSSVLDETDRSGFTVDANLTGRVAAGYNNARFYAGISYLGNFIRNQTPVPGANLGYDTGMYRLNIVYRFRLKKDYRLLSQPNGLSGFLTN